LAGPDGSKSDNFDYDVTFVDFKKKHDIFAAASFGGGCHNPVVSGYHAHFARPQASPLCIR
jgi:hypothetical protein